MDFRTIIKEHQQVVELLLDQCIPAIESIAQKCSEALKNGHMIFLCGNGGSAADCQHIAAEFVGRFVAERRGLPAIALTTDTSILTAVGNDYGYEQIFARQVEALVHEGDVVIHGCRSADCKSVSHASGVSRSRNT